MRAFSALALFLTWSIGEPVYRSVTTTTTTTTTTAVFEDSACFEPGLNVSLAGHHFSVVSVPWFPISVHENGSWIGIYDTLLEHVALKAGFTYTQRMPLDGTFAGGVGEVERGEADIAVGAWWHCAMHADRVDLMLALQSQSLRVLTRIVPHTDPLSRTMFLFLEPFSSSLWLVIVGLIIVSAAIMFRLESRINKIDFEPDRKEDQWKMGLMKSVYLCFMAINAGPSHEPIQWSCRIVKVWWAFISMVIVAMYTANLVAIFGAAEEFVHPVDSIGDFLKFGKTACVLEGSVVAQFLSYRYPTLATHEFAGFAEAFEALDDGTCAGIVDVPADTMSHQIPAGKCDNYEWVGEELSQLQLGVLGNPGNAEMNRQLAIAFERELEVGALTRATKAWLGEDGFFSCTGTYDDGSDGNPQLDISQMAGVFVTYAVIVGLLLVTMKIENMRRSTEAFDVDLLALDEPMLKAGEAPEDATEQKEADAVADDGGERDDGAKGDGKNIAMPLNASDLIDDFIMEVAMKNAQAPQRGSAPRAGDEYAHSCSLEGLMCYDAAADRATEGQSEREVDMYHL